VFARAIKPSRGEYKGGLKFRAAGRAQLATHGEVFAKEIEVADTKPQANCRACVWKRCQNPGTCGFVEFNVRSVERDCVYARYVHRSLHPEWSPAVRERA
jgi:hypothetical protein